MKNLLTLTAGALALALLGGCASSEEATRIEAGGNRSLTTVGSINLADWNIAADELVDSLLRSDALINAPRQPAVMAISNIVNNTTQQVDTTMLTNRVRERLNVSGKVVTSTIMGVGGTAQDSLAREQNERDRFLAGSRTQDAPKADYTLSGRLNEIRVADGNRREATYSFYLALTDTRTGIAVWEKTVDIAKSGRRASTSW